MATTVTVVSSDKQKCVDSLIDIQNTVDSPGDRMKNNANFVKSDHNFTIRCINANSQMYSIALALGLTIINIQRQAKY